jgi:hypothetical protein
MTHGERIFLTLAALGVVAVVIFELRQPAPVAMPPTDPNGNGLVSNTPKTSDLTTGPGYLIYNQPYAFSPPVANFIPENTMGENGVATSTVQGQSFSTCDECGG